MPFRPRSILLAGLLGVVVLVPATPAAAAVPHTIAASANSNGVLGNRASAASSVSADGRYVAFLSHSTNLVPGDTNRRADIFVRDLRNSTNRRASLGPGSVQANGPSNQPAISANGRFVAFSSFATNLVAGDTNNQPDVFVRDMVAGTTRRVSLRNNGGQANGDNAAPAISADGRYIAFISSASNLVAGDTNGTSDTFVRDTVANTTTRVSVATGGGQANAFSDAPTISADGQLVVFASPATNLVAGDSNGTSDVFLRDRVAGVTVRVSVGAGGAPADGPVTQPAISANGRHVAFVSEATNLVATDTDASPDVVVRNLVVGVNTQVSFRTDSLPGSFASEPAVSADGNLIAFNTSSDLVPADTNSLPDIYLRNVSAARTELISIGLAGAPSNGPNADPSISGSGGRVAFSSGATNLVAGDTNTFDDVFVRLR